MMTTRLKRWLGQMWQRPDYKLIESYRVTYSGIHGELVMQDMLDNIYFTVCSSNKLEDLIAHNEKRKVVHEILKSIDIATRPQKYTTTVDTGDQ